MLLATKIVMKAECRDSCNTWEIDRIELDDGKFYKKETIHDHLVNNPCSIKVNISPYPLLIPAIRENEKYVRSEPNDTTKDNLMKLPKVTR